MTTSQLIEKHLAEGLTAEETASFTAQLTQDPEIARHMAEAARLEVQLLASLRPPSAGVSWPDDMLRPSSERRWKPRWSAPLARIAAVLSLIGAALATVAWIRSAYTPGSTPAATGNNSQTRPFVPPPVPIVREAMPRQVKPETESPSMASLRRLLAEYYLTDVNMQTARPLDQAIQNLLSRARAVNRLNNPQIAQLSFETNDEEMTHAHSVSLPTNHISLLNSLRWIAALNRSDLFLKEPGIITFRPWEMASADSFATEEIPMPPDLLIAKEHHDAIESPAIGSPPEATTPSAEKILTPTELFRSWGVSFWGTATATYDEPSGRLSIHHAESSLRMIREVLELNQDEQGGMVDISTKFFQLPHDFNTPNSVLRPQEFQQWLKHINQLPEIVLLAAPHVTARSGQQAMIESGESGGGWWFAVKPVFEGETIVLKGSAELRFPKTRPPGQKSLFAPGNASVGELEVIETEVDGWVPAGQTAVFALDESTGRPRIVMTVTVNRVPHPGGR